MQAITSLFRSYNIRHSQAGYTEKHQLRGQCTDTCPSQVRNSAWISISILIISVSISVSVSVSVSISIAMSILSISILVYAFLKVRA